MSPGFHPRVHGEDQRTVWTWSAVGGSPPCARGRPSRHPWSSSPLRFTPVCTGKTDQEKVHADIMAVHPRVHGEDAEGVRQRPCAFGSPPCARGRPTANAWSSEPIRFTPVCTGKTPSPVACGRYHAVHPRVHGEDYSASEMESGDVGSPPCARGRRRPELCLCLCCRFTPVCTGKTRMPVRLPPAAPVHPRVHGEDQPPPTPR